ncbi:hypothetical protein M8494_03615 [Serratia ureilytica]
MSLQQRADYIQVAGWAGHDEEVVALWRADGAALQRDSASDGGPRLPQS